jgi:hypothetical protein
MRYDGTHVQQLTDNQWEEGTPAWLPWKETKHDESKIVVILGSRTHTNRRALRTSGFVCRRRPAESTNSSRV